MKNKISKYIFSACLVSSVMFVGCADFMEVSDDSSVSPDVFPTSLNQVDLMLNSAYAGGHLQGLYAFYWFPMGIYLYDNTSNTYGTYDDRGNQLSNNTDPDCQYTTQTYADIMKWIQLSNAAIEGIERYRPAASESGYSQLNYMKGQALFNRALAYWHAQVFFEIESKKGSLGFPIIKKVPKTLDEMMPQRATTADTWQFVVETLNEAIPLLKGHVDKTRATEWGAKGLLTKVLMQARRPQEAKPVLEDIINNSGAKLMPFNVYSNMFYADEKYEFNDETLYEIDMTMNPKQNGPWEGYTTGSAMQMVFGPWPMNLDFRWKKPVSGVEIATQATGAWGNNYVHDMNIHRFGFNEPNPGCRVANPDFNSKAARSINNLPWILDPAYKLRSQQIRDNKEADPRLFISAAQPYFDTLRDTKKRETYYDRSPEALDYYSEWLCWNHKKFTNREGFESSLNYSSPANIPIIRLADIYLLYAEVLKDSDPAVALEYINKVHRRAYDCPIDQPSQYDYTSFVDKTMAGEGDHLSHDVLKYERWAELFGEGQWWFDVRRWEIGGQEMEYFKENRNGTLIWLGNRCYVQPIPKTEIERYNGNLTQSETY